MTPHSLTETCALAAALAVAGVILGRCYFGVLRWSVARYTTGRTDTLQSAALALGRMLCAAGLLAIAARLGALPLLAAFLGFLAARTSAVRAARSLR